MIYQVQIPIGGLPINLVLLGNRDRGSVVFVKVATFSAVFDDQNEGVKAVFKSDDFTLDGETYFYNTIYEYKLIPAMLNWLKQQNLEEPNNIVFR